MKRNLYAIFITLVSLYSCQQPQPVNNITTQQTVAKKPPVTDSLKALSDTAGLSTAPIKILSANISSKVVDTVDQPADNLNHKGHFGRFITIKAKYKNVSSKRIVGARLIWLIVDKAGNPVTVDASKLGIQMGYMGTLAEPVMDFSFAIGETKTDEWEYTSNSGQNIRLAYPQEVEFYDKTKWRIGKK
jgi:hypothetical protein